MPRASDVQKTQRLNRARELLRQFKERAQAVTELARECSISPRQAHRYIQHAQQLKPETVHPGKRRQARVYGKTATQLDSTRTALCTRQEAARERGGHAGVARAGTTRARAWVSRNQLGHTLSSWNIVWIDCYRRSWPRLINYWCPSSAGPPVGQPAKMWR